MSNIKNTDEQRVFLIRYSIDEKEHVSFTDPCSDEIPPQLLGKVMRAFSNVERSWNKNLIKIRKGQKFLCKETVVMDDDEIAYIKGEVYTSEANSCITDIYGDKKHKWTEHSGPNGWSSSFELIDS